MVIKLGNKAIPSLRHALGLAWSLRMSGSAVAFQIILTGFSTLYFSQIGTLPTVHNVCLGFSRDV